VVGDQEEFAWTEPTERFDIRDLRMIALTLLLLGSAAVRWPSFGPLELDTPWLIPPIAAWLVQRFGRTAWFVVIAIVLLLVLLEFNFDRDSFALGGRADIAILALACASLAKSGIEFRDVAALPPPARGWMAAPLLLPLFVSLAPIVIDDLSIALSWYVLGLLLPLLFVAALRGAPWHGYALSTLLAIALGAAIALATRGRAQSGAGEIGYSFVQPYLWLPSLMAWSAGEAVRRAVLGMAPRRFWSRPLLAVLVILALWIDPGQAGFPLELRTGWAGLRWLGFAGATAALPLAGFVAGALLGMRGAWFVAGMALLPALVAVGAYWASDGHLQMRLGNVFAAPIALAWGWLGARLGGRMIAAPSLRISMVVLVVGVMTFALLTERTAGLQFALSLVAALATAVLGALAARLGNRLGVTGEGWIPVLLLPIYAFGLVSFGPSAFESFSDETDRLIRRFDRSDSDEFLFQMLVLASLLLAAALLLGEILRAITWLPKILRELRILLLAARAAVGS